MYTYEKFKEYIWMVNTIHRAHRITFQDFNAHWHRSPMSGGIDMPRSTFNRHRDAIKEIFGIHIKCNGNYEYFISNSDVLHENSLENWMLSTLSVGNMISESKSLQQRILLEQIPSQGTDLFLILDAMKKSVCVRIQYQKYQDDTPHERLIEPYCVRMFKLRWYVLGLLHDEGEFRIYSLDRVQRTDVTDIHFQVDPRFSAEKHFRDSYGVFVNEQIPVERIVVRAYGTERFYQNSLHIHPSQRVIGEGENYIDFELHLRPTMDFCNYVLGRSNLLRVLSPQSVVDTLRNLISEAQKLYS